MVPAYSPVQAALYPKLNYGLVQASLGQTKEIPLGSPGAICYKPLFGNIFR